ncbi:unnamed protein product [Discosporangium mesarthrocarpum]
MDRMNAPHITPHIGNGSSGRMSGKGNHGLGNGSAGEWMNGHSGQVANGKTGTSRRQDMGTTRSLANGQGEGGVKIHALEVLELLNNYDFYRPNGEEIRALAGALSAVSGPVGSGLRERGPPGFMQGLSLTRKIFENLEYSSTSLQGGAHEHQAPASASSADEVPAPCATSSSEGARVSRGSNGASIRGGVAGATGVGLWEDTVEEKQDEYQQEEQQAIAGLCAVAGIKLVRAMLRSDLHTLQRVLHGFIPLKEVKLEEERQLRMVVDTEARVEDLIRDQGQAMAHAPVDPAWVDEDGEVWASEEDPDGFDYSEGAPPGGPWSPGAGKGEEAGRGQSPQLVGSLRKGIFVHDHFCS